MLHPSGENANPTLFWQLFFFSSNIFFQSKCLTILYLCMLTSCASLWCYCVFSILSVTFVLALMCPYTGAHRCHKLPLPVPQALSLQPRAEETTYRGPSFYVSSQPGPRYKVAVPSCQTNRYRDHFLARTSVEWNHLAASIVHITDTSSFKTAVYPAIAKHYFYCLHVFFCFFYHSFL